MAASSRLGVLMKLDKNQRKPRIFKASDLCTYNNTIVDAPHDSCCFHISNLLILVKLRLVFGLSGNLSKRHTGRFLINCLWYSFLCGLPSFYTLQLPDRIPTITAGVLFSLIGRRPSPKRAVGKTPQFTSRMHTARKQTADPVNTAGSAVCQCSDLPVSLFPKPFSAQDFHLLHTVPPEQLQRFRANSLTGHRNGDRRRTPHGGGAADPAQ